MIKTPEQKLSRNPSNAGYTNPLKSYDVPAKDNPDGTINVHAQPVYGIDPNHEPIDQYMAVRTIPGGNVSELTINALAIGAGGFARAVPAGRIWYVQQFTFDIVATATVGNRVLVPRILDATGAAQWIGTASAAITAGQTGGYDIGFGAPINTPSTAVRRNLLNTGNTNVQVRESCSDVAWVPLSQIAINDIAGIDNADVVYVRIKYVDVPA